MVGGIGERLVCVVGFGASRSGGASPLRTLGRWVRTLGRMGERRPGGYPDIGSGCIRWPPRCFSTCWT